MKKIAVIKQNGARQRSDTKLTKELATTLLQNILMGKALTSNKAQERGYIEVVDNDGNPKKIGFAMFNAWITRRNVIPETGEVLRDLLDKGREEYRNMQRREMDRKREEVIDKKFNRTISMKTKEVVVGMFGVVKDGKTGKPLMKENVMLLSEQMKNVRFLAERLYSNRYGKVERSENKHLVFSLSELRKYEDAKKIPQ